MQQTKVVIWPEDSYLTQAYNNASHYNDVTDDPFSQLITRINQFVTKINKEGVFDKFLFIDNKMPARH